MSDSDLLDMHYFLAEDDDWDGDEPEEGFYIETFFWDGDEPEEGFYIDLFQ